MPKKTDDEWLPDARGRYRRKVGWWVTKAGERKKYTFSFGTDKDQAKARLVRVKEVWAQVVRIHNEPTQSVGFPPLSPESSDEKGEPVWTGESLWIANVLSDPAVRIESQPNGKLV